MGDCARKVFSQCSRMGREEQTDSSSHGSFMFQLLGLNVILFCFGNTAVLVLKCSYSTKGGDLMAAPSGRAVPAVQVQAHSSGSAPQSLLPRPALAP